MERSGQVTDKAKVPEGQDESKMTRSDVKGVIKRMSEKLSKMDAQKHSGAPSRLPKERMLDARAIEEKEPESHFLYVNTDDPGNVQTHIDDGYTAVSEDEAKAAGVRQRVGELTLMRVPRGEFEERVERQKEVAAGRLEAHRTEFKREVESVVREMRDRGMSDHDIKRILVDE